MLQAMPEPYLDLIRSTIPRPLVPVAQGPIDAIEVKSLGIEDPADPAQKLFVLWMIRSGMASRKFAYPGL